MKKTFSRVILTTTFLLLLTSCSSMKITDFVNTEPQFVVEEYFQGKTWAWGIFEDRFGDLRRSFRVEIDGDWNGQRLILDEHFDYAGGEKSRRVWTITRVGENSYEGVADDVIGTATGVANGNALNWRYRLKLPVGDSIWHVSFDDWMFLQPDDKLINRATISKWGFTLGTVTLFFSKQAPE